MFWKKKKITCLLFQNRDPGPGTYEVVSKGLTDSDKSTRGGTGRRRKVYHQYHRRTGLSGLSSELAELSKKSYGHETAPVFGTAMDRFENPLGSGMDPVVDSRSSW